jgi:hypothetical protein
MKTNEEKIQTIVQVNPFMQMLAQLRDGGFVTECTEKIGQTIAAVKHTGQKGKLTLVLEIVPDDKGEVRTVDIVPEARTKLPERKKKATTFFVVGDQSLSRTGTSEQPEFDFEPRIARPMPATVSKLPGAKAAGDN